MGKMSIVEYFKGKNIFITGGSGFLGKCLIEKLLRSCPDIGNIYVLLRQKKGKAVYERLEQMLTCPVFDLLKEKCSDNFKKIIPINGDTAQLGFGMSKADKQMLINEVHIFFHGAASVRFDDFLKDAIFINIRGAREAALLALEMKHIEVYMHVSTSYCNIVDKKNIEEILYPPHGDWREAITVAENCDPDIINIFSQKYVGDFPNTYTYTKQLAEHCIKDVLLGKIPTVICRPSIVLSSISEPFMGWIDNFNGPTGLILAGGSGLVRIVYADPEINNEFIPVDNVIKLMITAAWNKGIARNVHDISIYHASNDTGKFRIEEYIIYGRKLRWEEPLENILWFPDGKLTSWLVKYFCMVILFHLLPAIFLDGISSIARLPVSFTRLQRKIYIANMALEHFMFNEWHFIDTNSQSLFQMIPPKELEHFNFNIMPIGESGKYEYFKKTAEHARLHLLMENKETSGKSLTKTKILYVLHIFVKSAFYGIAAWILLVKINVPHKFWDALCEYWESL